VALINWSELAHWNEKEKAVMKNFLIFLCLGSVLSVGLASSSLADESCYQLGYRYGLCATQTLHGLRCKPENDFVMPERCRGKEETKRGITAGAKAVYDTLNLDTDAGKRKR
jgi:hypothetical protein